MSDTADPTTIDGAPSRGAGAPPVGVLSGRYRVLALLGAGGMGSVYVADDLELGERVAVKLLRPECSDTPFIERLRSEVRLARRVTHKNVARTYDIGEHEGERFLTMEYVEGESLAARIAREGALDLAAFFGLASDVVAGLVAAHEAGVVHRDLKPPNILVAKDGRAVITDFGLAWSPDAGTEDHVAGTPSYMAPEQFVGMFDERSDVFALGVVLHVMLTATKPFAAAPSERPAHAPNPREERPGLPVPLGALVARCLEPDPVERFPTASAVREALASLRSRVEEDEFAPATVATSPTASVLHRVSPEPRSILLRGVGDAPDAALARGIRDELADRINEHASLCAFDDPERAHEASAHVGVRHDDEALIVDVRLFGSRGSFEFWRSSFRGTDAVDLARTAARGIEQALAVDAPVGAALRPLGKEAADLYFAGRDAYHQFWPDPLRRAAASFEGALAHAPGHPLLLAALAATRARQSFFNEGFMDLAREAAELAVSLAPDLAEAYIASAAICVQDCDFEGGVVALLRAIDLAPGHAEALQTLGRILLEVGAPGDAIRLSEASHARDPNDLPLVVMARAHALLGQWDRVSATFDRMRTGAKDTIGLALRGRLAMWHRDLPAVRAAVDQVRAQDGGLGAMAYRLMLVIARAVLEGRSTRLDEESMNEELRESASRTRRTFVYQVRAEADAYVGDVESALTSIEGAVHGGLVDAFWMDRCPLFDDLRGSARFETAREVVQARARRVLGLLRAQPLGT